MRPNVLLRPTFGIFGTLNPTDHAESAQRWGLGRWSRVIHAGNLHPPDGLHDIADWRRQARR